MLRVLILCLLLGAATACGATTTPTPVPTAPPADESPTTAPPSTQTSVPPDGASGAEAPTATVPEPPASSATPPPASEPAAPFDPTTVTVALEPFVSGFSGPLGVTHAGDGSGRLFVVEKGGRIRVVQGQTLLPDPLLDISDLVSNGNEQGLLGLAIEPGRPERFYINYTDLAGDTVIARYRTTGDPNVADSASGEVLLTIDQPAANHNGGHLLFGPDGLLWIGTGDGGAAGDRFGNGQNPNALLGKMLRLDVSGETGYTIPSDNPDAAGASGEAAIWATGLRNPWRYSFDRATGELWIADVGQNNIEEVNRVPSGESGLNFGWPILEGSSCFSQQGCASEGFVLPVTEYTHSLGCSVTGGYVYRGAAFPALQGGYFFGDYCTGLLWAVAADAALGTEPTLLLETGLSISSFGEDEAGELYLTAFDGTLYRLTHQP